MIVAVASVLFATAAGAFSQSATNTYFSVGSGASRVCAKGIASIDVYTPGVGGTQVMDIYSDDYSRTASNCLTPYGVNKSLFQNKASLYEGYPAVFCATTNWVQYADDGNSYSHIGISGYAGSGGSCLSNGYYFTYSEQEYWYPFSWFYGNEESPAEYCGCVV